MRIIRILLTEVLILLIAAGAGLALDYIFFLRTQSGTGAAGHPMPVFLIVLPLAAALIMGITDLILILKAIVKKLKK